MGLVYLRFLSHLMGLIHLRFLSLCFIADKVELPVVTHSIGRLWRSHPLTQVTFSEGRLAHGAFTPESAAGITGLPLRWANSPIPRQS